MISMWQWSSAIELGIDSIDNQHKQLIERVNALGNQVDKTDKNKVGIDTINFLKQYIIEHFQEEEALQERINYPSYNDHKLMHQEFISRIDEVLKDYSDSEISLEIYYDLSRLLNEWIVEHIGFADIDIAKYMKENVKD